MTGDYDPARDLRLPDELPGTFTAAVDDLARLRDIAREHMPIEQGDARRWQHDADRIRRALSLPTYAEHTLEMSCFNREDAEQIKRRLTQDERLRVVFRYPTPR